MRFCKEYKNYQVKQIEANDLMNEGIKAEIIRRISRVYEAWEKSLLTTDELMESLSRRCMEDGEDMSRYYTEAKPEAAKQTEAEQTASTWMDYDSIIDFWTGWTNGYAIQAGNGDIVLKDYYDTWTYPSKKAAALDCLETIKVWAEDDDEAMQFLEEISNGEITEADIRQ